MGNQLTAPSRLTAAEAVSDLQSVTYKDSLGEGEVAVERCRPTNARCWELCACLLLLPAACMPVRLTVPGKLSCRRWALLQERAVCAR